MGHFELHVCQNEVWKRLDTFEDRDAAMSASIKSEHSQRYSAVKVIRETYDERDRVFKTKLVHKWSETISCTTLANQVYYQLVSESATGIG